MNDEEFTERCEAVYRCIDECKLRDMINILENTKLLVMKVHSEANEE